MNHNSFLSIEDDSLSTNTMQLSSRSHLLTTKQDYENFVSVLGITALLGYEANVNRTIGLCKDARQDYNLLVACAKTNIQSYREKRKHRIMHACLTGNVDWFKNLFTIGNVNDILELRTKDYKTLYHLVCISPDNMGEVHSNNISSTTFHCAPLSNIMGRLATLKILNKTSLPLVEKDDDGNTCFFLAIQYKEIDLVNAFIQRLRDDPTVFNINSQDNNGNTAMHIAIKAKNIDIVKCLCELKVDITIINKQRRNALVYCVIHGSVEIMRLFIEKYSNIFDINYINHDDDDDDYDDFSLMHYAVKYVRINMIQYFITLPNMNIDTSDELGRTPLFYAIINGDTAIIEMLLQNRDRVNINHQDDSGATPLHIACENNHTEIVRLLLDAGCNFIYQNKGYVDIIVHCVIHGNVEMLKLLIEQYSTKFDINYISNDNNGLSLMHNAVLYNRLDMLRYFVSLPNMNIDRKDVFGHTPLFYAASIGKESIVNLLLQYCDRININSQDNDGFTPLHAACAKNHVDIVRLLVDAGCDTTIQNNDKSNALVLCAARGNVETVKFLFKYYPTKFDINYSNHDDGNGWSLMHYAVLKDRFAMVQYFASLSTMNIDMKDTDGRTPLLCASINGKTAVVNILLQHRDRININSQDNDGFTPLHTACEKNNNDIVRLLLDAGCDTNIKTNYGNTALMIARNGKYDDIINLLQQHTP